MEAFDKPQKFGDYRLFAKVDQGGMAKVFLASSTKKQHQGQFIAIKKLHDRLNQNKPFVNLLIHEAKIGVLLNHPGIAQVFDLGNYKNEFFIAMEFVHGKSLDRLLELIRLGQAAPMPIEVATYVAMEVLRALAFAHSLKDVKGRDLNIVHRDVSPGNILLEYKGNVKLTDFGIATAESRLQVEFTQSAMGKLIYMAPEQAVNDPVVCASDIYSLAIVYYELLTGKRPFESDSPTDLFRKVVDGRMSDIRIISPRTSDRLAEIIEKAMHKSVRKRYQSAPEFFKAINQYFIDEENIDFNTRTIRSYYRKKLAEYMREAFSNSIANELQIIQTALEAPEEDEDLKITKPQEIPAELANADLDLVDDNTIIQPDHTDEATRHYPLTEEERKQILKGLPPKEVITSPPKERTSDFELATIPRYDIQLDDSKIEPITVGQKLDDTSLNRDEQENLKSSMPAVEITSQQDLDAFESSTFSGAKPDSVEEDFGDQKTRTQDEEATDGSQTLSKTPNKESKEEVKQKKPRRLGIGSKKSIKIVGSVAASIFVVALIGLVGKFAFEKIQTQLATPPGLLPIKQVSIVITGEAAKSEQGYILRALGDTKGLTQVEEFFNSEYAKHTKQNKRVLRLLAHEPVPLNQSLSLRLDFERIVNSKELFSHFTEMGLLAKQAADATIFLYLYSPETVKYGHSNFPKEFKAQRPKSMGVIFAEADPTELTALLLKISREVAFVFGATNKQNAELMAKDIPTKPLEDLVIGTSTAQELGWIDSAN